MDWLYKGQLAQPWRKPAAVSEIPIAVLTFAGLVAASTGSLLFYERLPPAHRQDDTHSVVRSVTSLFAVLTSLVLGLMINSAKGTFESADRNVQSFAINLILLDRTLRVYGSDADPSRLHLVAYAQELLEDRVHTIATPLTPDSDRFLTGFAEDLKRLHSGGPDRAALWQELQQLLRKVVELRWTLIEQTEATIPVPLMMVMIAWLMLIFAGFGYRAPRNAVVITTLVVSAALIACTIYLILDMDSPFDGPIRVSPAPLERALAEMRR